MDPFGAFLIGFGGSPDGGYSPNVRRRGRVRHIWFPRPPPRLGVGPGLRGRSPFRVARVLRGEGRRRRATRANARGPVDAAAGALSPARSARRTRLGSAAASAGRLDLFDHLEGALDERLLNVLGDLLEASRVVPVAVADALTLGQAALIEAERDDHVLVVSMAEVVGPDGLRGPALRLPSAAEPLVRSRLEASGREKANHRDLLIAG